MPRREAETSYHYCTLQSDDAIDFDCIICFFSWLSWGECCGARERAVSFEGKKLSRHIQQDTGTVDLRLWLRSSYLWLGPSTWLRSFYTFQDQSIHWAWSDRLFEVVQEWPEISQVMCVQTETYANWHRLVPGVLRKPSGVMWKSTSEKIILSLSALWSYCISLVDRAGVTQGQVLVWMS